MGDSDRFNSEEDVLEAMRTVWGSNSMTSADLEQFCPTAKVCKNVADLGIRGMDDEDMAHSLRAEWKNMLERDGKIPDNVETIGDIVASMTETQPK
jgi:hypothetical protein